MDGDWDTYRGKASDLERKQNQNMIEEVGI